MKDDNGIREPMVLLDGVELKLDSEAGSVNILKGINLEIAAGETVSVVGPSGSGKTSMMMLIGGLERQTGGRVQVAGMICQRWTKTGWRGSAATMSVSCSRIFTSCRP